MKCWKKACNLGKNSYKRLGSRVARLEETSAPEKAAVIIVQESGETEEDAICRWKAENPGESLENRTVCLIKIVDPDEERNRLSEADDGRGQSRQ